MVLSLWETRPIKLDRIESQEPAGRQSQEQTEAAPEARTAMPATEVGAPTYGMVNRAPAFVPGASNAMLARQRRGPAITPAPTQQIARNPLVSIAARAAAALASASRKLAATGTTLANAAEAADRLGKVGGLVGSGVSATGQAAGWLSAGGHSAGSKPLPGEAVSQGDMDKLKVLAQYRIVNWVCTQWVNDPANREIVDYLRNPAAAQTPPAAGTQTPPAAGTQTPPPAQTPAPAPTTTPPAAGGTATPTPPAVTPDADAIRDEVIEAAKNNVQLELSQTLQANRQNSGPEYWWGEDDTHDGEESVGVSGRIYFTDVQTTVIDEDVNLNEAAKLLRIPLPDRGAMRIRKIVSGSLHNNVVASTWDSLTISPADPNVSSLGPEGSVSMSVAVDWVWDGNTTASDHLLFVNPDGTAEWSVRWSGEPDDNSLFPSFEDSGTHRSWGNQEEFGGPAWPGMPNGELLQYQSRRAAGLRGPPR
jgi:hypothetical protein